MTLRGYLVPSSLATVAVGGAAGTLVRAEFDSIAAGVPLFHAGSTVLAWSTLLVNVVGSFLLGALLGAVALARLHHPGSLAIDRVRLLAGTGFLGGFTTYSSFALQTTHALQQAPLVGLLWGGGMVAAGLVAAMLGAETVRRAWTRVIVSRTAAREIRQAAEHQEHHWRSRRLPHRKSREFRQSQTSWDTPGSEDSGEDV